MSRTMGLHHVTAISADARKNVAFYTGVLGLRLVKRSVNQDDPATYHLYFGDESGAPGTIMTFFPWQGIRRGQVGTGQVAATAFAIPKASLGWWIERLVSLHVAHQGPEKRFGETVLRVHDPDGLVIELVATDDARGQGWGGGTVPAEHAIRGFHSVTIWAHDAALTAPVLTGVLGFEEQGREGSVTRYVARGDERPGVIVDLRHAEGFPRGMSGAGTVHHVAFRVPDDAGQAAVRQAVRAAGMHPTPVVERFYFRSVYFHEPGGVLFELATNEPGFAVDEPLDQLGTQLKLPPWLETNREQIEAALPDIDVDREPLTVDR